MTFIKNHYPNKIITKYPQVQIITHTDLDGYGSGAILVKILENMGYTLPAIDVTHADYSNPLPFKDGYKFVIISDISISNQKDAYKLLEFAETPGNMLIWIDHHQTSIDMENTILSLKNVYGKRDVNACGTMLCWMFMQCIQGDYTDKGFVQAISLLKYIDVKDSMNSSNPGIVLEISNDVINHTTPHPIRLVDDWDRHVLEIPNSAAYAESFESYPKFEHSCKSTYFQQYFCSTNISSIAYSHLMELHSEFLKFGSVFSKYKKFIQLQLLSKYGFIAAFTKTPNVKMICIESNFKGSDHFGPILDASSDNDVMRHGCIFLHNNKKDNYSVSVYDTDPEEKMNAGEICKIMGGGGHPGAAGFITPKMEFVDIEPLPPEIKDHILKVLIKLAGELN